MLSKNYKSPDSRPSKEVTNLQEQAGSAALM